ncbi:hypothetical protein AVENLUH5627_03277 [Acinetobacter venetianus]|uniref:YagK/YfjJ C-terminal domain-containing protein n=1 Tax=Acinetobacter venetianus TaxID=52133 RepID=A0A150HJQ0_9GAMM|nr:inovirus-type Gp2 protein [Acinetobacter venetianus]KXZ63376.1 hypothetical protein AVENLUH5627_03277 [Acinetobacter venetianus]
MNMNQNTLHEPNLIIEIESFTKTTIEQGLQRNDLPRLIKLLDGFERIYSCNHSYSDYLGLFDFIAEFEFQNFKKFKDGKYSYESLLKVSDQLLDYFSWQFQVHKPKVDSDLRQYKHRVKRRLESLKKHVEDLFNHYSRNLVVRVDLKYRADSQNRVDIEIFNKHVRTLRNRMANKDKCFRNLKFNAWCLEHAPEGGYHVHLFLIYDGSTSTYDCKLARWVGRVWMSEITEGLGYYWNCHTRKNADEDLEVRDMIVVNMESSQEEQNY